MNGYILDRNKNIIMRRKTINEIFEQVMQNYTYSVTRNGQNVEITGCVSIDGIGREITFKKVFRIDQYNGGLRVEQMVFDFKEEFGEKIKKVIEENYELLSDDREMIDYLNLKIKELNEELEKVRRELEAEKIKNVPLVQPYQPWAVPCDGPYKPITITYATNTVQSDVQ